MSFKCGKPHLSKRFFVLGVLCLSGCGFRPVFGDNGAGNALRNNVSFQTEDTVFGFRVRNALSNRFGAADDPELVVTLDLSEQQSTAAVTSEGVTTRFDLTGRANWVLSTVSGSEMSRGSVQTFTSYSATGSTVATQAAEIDAREKLGVALADLVAADLIAAVVRSSS